MKEVWSSIFQTVSESVKTLSERMNKKARHDVVLMTAGISVMTLLTFTAGDLSGNGQNAMVAFAETHMQTIEAETELEITNFDAMLIGEEHMEETQTIEDLFIRTTEESVPEATSEAAETEETSDKEEYTEAEDIAETVAEEEPTEEAETTIPEAQEAEEEDDEKMTLSPDEYSVLLKIVQAEAGTCDEDGKLLVANVILNRMESEQFPDTVREVVYQKRQFSPVMNGTINTCKITMETRKAVNRALKGEDISEGALYFMNRRASARKNVRWFDANLEYLFKHGNHEFFK